MAWVLSRHENEGQDKHVESVWFPRVDEGSIPSTSTIVNYDFLHFHKNSDVYASLFLYELLQKSFAGILQQFYHQLKVTLSPIIGVWNSGL